PFKEHVNETEQIRTIEILKENNVRTIVLYRGQGTKDNNPVTYSYIINEYYVNYTVGDFDVLIKK
ncbi:MAG: hypothetical protein QMD85_02140, partial [Candidatus Aenigmarchaeota archaeon]|nr:hypothetical protein [Candidatus Aenigmarchaeota archaeon]MDI6722350.1 hypothetical protein [Candidatus Aenigmarchaeota archaeon]